MNFIAVISISIIVFFIGLIGIFINRKNILLIIICVELNLLAINFAFLISSFYLDDVLGQIYTIFILVVAAAETSIGLAILVVYYRIRGTISIEFLNKLRS
jgi:NADH:ubiquinone oxidoreductase subunit K|tara:strand:- start:146 stop:448 length:303 start_codon:yes stop_codon:yes gene_type:complete